MERKFRSVPEMLAEIHALIGDELVAEVADAMDLKPERSTRYSNVRLRNSKRSSPQPAPPISQTAIIARYRNNRRVILLRRTCGRQLSIHDG